MKICLINSLYKPYRRGGAEVIFSRIVKELKNNGYDIFVITVSAQKKSTSPFVKYLDGIKVYRFYPKNIFSFVDINSQPLWKRLIWHFIDTFNYHSYRQIKKILRQEKPDLVFSHNLKGLGYLTLKAVRKMKIKNVHTLHDVQLVEPSGLIINGKEKQSWHNLLYAQITKLLFASPDMIIAPSQWLLDFYSGYGFFSKSLKKVLPNPIVIEPEQRQIIKKFEDQRITYLILGQLESHKGILFLLEVFEQFNKSGDCRLLAVGSGSLEKMLRQKYADCDWLEFLGFVPQKDLGRHVFKQVHYAIIPSICYENSPGAIYDSLKYGTPVIASNLGGIPELVQEGVTGYTFEPGNKISLLNKLNMSLKNMGNFQQMSENAKIKAEDYDIKKYIYKLLNL